MQRSTLFSLAAVSALAVAPAANAAFVDFNEASDLNDFDEIDGYSFAPAPAGVGSTGGLSVDGNGDVAQFTPETFSLGEDETLTVSQEGFYANELGGGLQVIRVGLTDELDTGFGGGNFVQGTLIGDQAGTAADDNEQLQIQAGGDALLTSEINIAAGNFYRLVIDFTGVGANQVQITANLFNIGPDGETAATLAAGPFSSTFTQAAIRSDSTLYGAFKSNAASGVTVLDNFSIIPEPASLALLGLGGLMLLPRRRRA